MPTVGVDRDALFKSLGKTYTEEEFEILCFDFGVELDDVTSEKQMARKEQGGDAGGSDNVIYKIDVPANRYDLLCIEGIARGFRIFLGQEPPPLYKVVQAAPAAQQTITVKAATAQIRPFVACAVLRGLTLDHGAYNSFLDLQDKMHQNICRRRTLVAIGTHDLAKVQGPFTYEALPPKEIKFVPLNQEKEYDAAELMEFYRTDPSVKHIKPYTDIIYDSPVYPVIYDAERTVLSLPPIINGNKSCLSTETKDCFIECTATDYTKAKIVLQTIVAMFSEHCAEPFTIEPVNVVYEAGAAHAGETHAHPNMDDWEAEAKVANVRSLIGVESITPEQMCALCNKMQLGATFVAEEEKILCKVPPTRTDILHEVDIIEDIAIAYGFNNIPKTLPTTATVGKQLPVNQISDLLRDELARAGYMEILSLGLCGVAENYGMLKREDDGLAVQLSNPMTVEFEIVRTSLLPGMLKTLKENKALPMKDGLKLFEVSDVVHLDAASDVGASNKRRLIALYTGPTAGFEVIHGLVDRVMGLLEVGMGRALPGKTMSYSIEPTDQATFFPGRAATLQLADGETKTALGSFGVLHPEVLAAYEIKYPCSVVEFDIEAFL
jgi:phenylalanyl-tRNA synthetase beta chain